MDYPDSSPRHWRFIYASITDMNNLLRNWGRELYIFNENLPDLFTSISRLFEIKNIFSHEETGNAVTFRRDKEVKKFCDSHNIIWHEYPQNAVIRGAVNRNQWDKHWFEFMSRPCENPELTPDKILKLNEETKAVLPLFDPVDSWVLPDPQMQPGGMTAGNRYLKSFLESRCLQYTGNISKPEKSRTTCSRLSPYLAYGNISSREVYQKTLAVMKEHASKRRHLNNFLARLKWRCHFIQKFESECKMEFQAYHRVFADLKFDYRPEWIKSWEEGRTGYPLVDASVRCLIKTGYLNFRMRAMLVSFLSFNLGQDWRKGVHFLARLFLDYEPGIHYPQFQMQAAVTGIHTVRVYNPVLNSQRLDSDAAFIYKWCPELRSVPADLVHEPYNLTEIEQRLYNIRIGEDYPLPVVDLKSSVKQNVKRIYDLRKTEEAARENERIKKKHVRPQSGGK